MAALVHIPAHLGYLALALLIGAESTGVPLPGETALIDAALLSRDGELRIELVIAVAAAAAIVGDNFGYVLGRRFGRRLITRPDRFGDHRRVALESGQAFFDRHGPKAVFLGRFVAALRIWAAWIAGMTHMPWRRFLLWNALGGVVWAAVVGLAAYLLGEAKALGAGRGGGRRGGRARRRGGLPAGAAARGAPPALIRSRAGPGIRGRCRPRPCPPSGSTPCGRRRSQPRTARGWPGDPTRCTSRCPPHRVRATGG